MMFLLWNMDKLVHVLHVVVRLSEVSASGLLEQVKLKKAFIMLIVLSLRKQNILFILRINISYRVFQEMRLYRIESWKHFTGVFCKHARNKTVLRSLWLYRSCRVSRGLDDGGAATVRALMHWQYWIRTISREETSILHNLNQLLGPRTPIN